MTYHALLFGSRHKWIAGNSRGFSWRAENEQVRLPDNSIGNGMDE
jgi:hypothetical protein